MDETPSTTPRSPTASRPSSTTSNGWLPSTPGKHVDFVRTVADALQVVPADAKNDNGMF